MISDKLREKLSLHFIWPSSLNTSSSTNPNTNSNTWRAYDSTDRGTCIDWCMSRSTCMGNTSTAAAAEAGNQQTNDTTTNHQQMESRLTVYESWFSDHKPLWLEIFLPNEHQHQNQQ